MGWELALLAEGELSHLVLDLHLAGRTLIKFDGEGGVALDDRRCWDRRDTLGGILGVLCGNLINLRLCFLDRPLLQLLGWDLKVAGFPVVGVDGLGVIVRQRTVDIISGDFFSRIWSK